MKKIFAIALAVVMVLSMASAFAWCPTGFSWDCSTTVCANGTGKVEVIPYVKGNGCGTGNTWSASTCAGAVNGDKVYAAIKVTVDADPNEDWWNKADLTMTVKGMKAASLAAGTAYTGMTADDFNTSFKPGAIVKAVKAVEENEGKFKAGEYYIVPTTTIAGAFVAAVPAADFAADKTNLWSATVAEAAKAKFCVKLTSELKVGKVEINNKYVVEFKAGTLTITNKKDAAQYAVLNIVDEKVKTISYASETLVAFDGAAFLASDADTFGVSCEPWKWLADALNYFGIGFGTCINADTVNANLGWDNEVESCFSWSSDVQAVVDAECVVAIPKTGDASVLAWLF